MSSLIEKFASIVWGPWLMFLLVGAGIYLSIRFGFVQIRMLKESFRIISGHYDDQKDPGEISHFKALVTALSATVGTGNIVGVAAAVTAGGPGAVFWMWITALVGMATKFASCTLAVQFRKIDSRGIVHGGPMHFIDIATNGRLKWLAVMFALFTVMASFGIGNMFQINNIAGSGYQLISPYIEISQSSSSLMIGLFSAFLVGLVILGGIKRIAVAASFIVPAMCILYIASALICLLLNSDKVLEAFNLIFYHAFHAPESIAGGLLGGVIRAGVSRGLFSNEAGLGSAAIAHGAAKTDQPIREGLVAMVGPLIDTLIICTLTALVVIVSGLYDEGIAKGILTSQAFGQLLPGSGYIVSVAIILFAFSTLIAWSYYGDRACDYLFGERSVIYYRSVYIIFIIIGAIKPLDDVINFCDAMNGLMAIPNIIGVLILSTTVAVGLKKYQSSQNQKSLC